jgi:hypothetical protein
MAAQADFCTVARQHGNECIGRAFCMPNPYTFEMKPVRELLSRYVRYGSIVVDPFCGKSDIATVRNDIRFGGCDAVEFLRGLDISADVVLLDPPYSPRQMAESYKLAGIIKKGCEQTQNAKLYSEAISELDRVLRVGGLAIRFGWNALGFPKARYQRLETLIVDHGGAHNATIVTVDEKVRTLASKETRRDGE